MVCVLSLVNKAKSSSIPLEIAAKANQQPNTEVVVASFYEQSLSECDEEVQEYDVRIEPLSGKHRLDFTAYRKLTKLVRGLDTEVLHTHHNSVGSLARLAVTGTGVAIVNTEHRNHDSFSSIQRLVNAVTFPRVDELIANSKTTLDSLFWYEKLLAKRATLSVIYNGVDTDLIDKCRQQNEYQETDRPHLVTVGRLVPIKNQKVLLHALPEILDEFPNTCLTIVGDGPQRAKLEQTTRRLNIEDSVRFTGRVARCDVYDILDTADIFLITSESEGFCVAATEAMMCGVPVIASNIEVLHEVVGDAGTYVPHDRPAEISNKTLKLLRDDNKRDRLGQESEQRALENFDIEQTAKRYCEIYERVSNQ